LVHQLGAHRRLGRPGTGCAGHHEPLDRHRLAPASRPGPGLRPAPANPRSRYRPHQAAPPGGTGMTARPSSPVALDRDRAWPVIVAERLRLADLLAELSDGDWHQPSLCAGWSARDVAAHMTLQQLGARTAAGMMITYRGDTDRAIRECARKRSAAWPTGKIIA